MATVKSYLGVVFLSLTALVTSSFNGKAVASGYSVLAKAALAAPIVAKIVVHTQRQPPKELRSAVPGRIRLIMEADVVAVLKAPDLVPGRITYLWEGPLSAQGKQPKFKKQTFTLFLLPGSDGDNSYRLATQNAQQPWSDADEQTLRQIIKEAAADPAGAARIITNVRSGLIDDSEETAGSINFILDTQSGNPIALSLRDNTVLVSSSDGIADGVPVQPRTLTWYQLACGLPAALPDQVMADQDKPDDAAKLRAAYAKIVQLLGPCE